MAKTRTKNKKNTQLDGLVWSIGKIVKGRNRLARQAERQYSIEVANILLTQSRDARRINRTLDGMLDFCFDPTMLRLYKKLCRYYYDIDPITTASYVYAYRDMWDSNKEEPSMTK